MLAWISDLFQGYAYEPFVAFLDDTGTQLGPTVAPLDGNTPFDTLGGFTSQGDRLRFERIPAGRWGVPPDLGGLAVFLSSRASDYIHGATIFVELGPGQAVDRRTLTHATRVEADDVEGLQQRHARLHHGGQLAGEEGDVLLGDATGFKRTPRIRLCRSAGVAPWKGVSGTATVRWTVARQRTPLGRCGGRPFHAFCLT